MASLEASLCDKIITKLVRAAIDKVICEYAGDGVLMFPYCPDCMMVMTKTTADYKGREYPVWECECSIAAMDALIDEEVRNFTPTDTMLEVAKAAASVAEKQGMAAPWDV